MIASYEAVFEVLNSSRANFHHNAYISCQKLFDVRTLSRNLGQKNFVYNKLMNASYFSLFVWNAHLMHIVLSNAHKI